MLIIKGCMFLERIGMESMVLDWESILDFKLLQKGNLSEIKDIIEADQDDKSWIQFP